MRLSNTRSRRFNLMVNSDTKALDNSTVTAARRTDNNMAPTVDDNHVATSNSENNKRDANQGDQRRQSKVVLEGMGVVTEEEGGDHSFSAMFSSQSTQ